MMKRTLKDFWSVIDERHETQVPTSSNKVCEVVELDMEAEADTDDNRDDNDMVGNNFSSPSSETTSIISGSNRQSVSVPADIAINKSNKPVQPVMAFPVSMFGNTSRAFQQRWYTQYTWLEYSVELDAAFCFACSFFHRNPDAAFTSVGFRDWKHALGKKGVLTTHSAGRTHTEAMRTRSGQSIGVQLDNIGFQVICENRKYVFDLMESILHCSQQGIALRGQG